MMVSECSSGSQDPVESDVLLECAGKCGKKILSFFPTHDDTTWDELVEASFCIDCRTRMLREQNQ